MKAELRASLIYDFLQMRGDDPSEPFRDFVTVQIEIAEQQARKEALIEALRAANIEMARHSTGSGFDSQPAHVASWNIVQAIRALIEREAV